MGIHRASRASTSRETRERFNSAQAPNEFSSNCLPGLSDPEHITVARYDGESDVFSFRATKRWRPKGGQSRACPCRRRRSLALGLYGPLGARLRTRGAEKQVMVSCENLNRGGDGFKKTGTGVSFTFDSIGRQGDSCECDEAHGGKLFAIVLDAGDITRRSSAMPSARLRPDQWKFHAGQASRSGNPLEKRPHCPVAAEIIEEPRSAPSVPRFIRAGLRTPV